MSVRPPPYNNLFGLKFETGSYFLESFRNSVRTLGQISGRSGISMEIKVSYYPKCNVLICRFCIRNKLNTT